MHISKEIHDMNQQEIEGFLAIIKSGSISGASKMLYITQPALSRRIKNLEENLGCSLFTRHKGIRTIELTPQGKAFISIAQNLIAIGKDAQEIKQLVTNDVFKLGAISSVGTYLLPNILKKFLAKSKNLVIEYHDYRSVEAFDAVEKGATDLALISDNIYMRHVRSIPLFQEKMVLVMTKTATKNKIKTLLPSELNPAQEIRLPWYPEYELWHDYWFGQQTKPRILIDQMYMLQHFLSTPESWAIVPSSAVGSLKKAISIVTVPLKDGPPNRIIYALEKIATPSPQISNFLSLLHTELDKKDDIRFMTL
jgi:DNA-binding transcriptional LysR family regulator